jgi:hypothetical protein
MRTARLGMERAALDEEGPLVLADKDALERTWREHHHPSFTEDGHGEGTSLRLVTLTTGSAAVIECGQRQLWASPSARV